MNVQFPLTFFVGFVGNRLVAVEQIGQDLFCAAVAERMPDGRIQGMAAVDNRRLIEIFLRDVTAQTTLDM